MSEFKKFITPIIEKDLVGMNSFVLKPKNPNSLTYYEGNLSKDGRWFVEKASSVTNSTSRLSKYKFINFVNYLISKDFELYLKNDKEIEEWLNEKLKGTKTAVWGKKSHRNDVVKYLENSVRRMF